MRKNNGDKRELILQAAKKVFAENGYHQSSITQIASVAGIGDGTIYNYFQNKEHILQTLFHETIYNQFVPGLQQALEPYQDARFMLLEIVRYHFHFFQSDPEAARVIQIESRQSIQRVREAMRPGIRSYARIIDATINQGMEQQLFVSDIPVRVSRKMIFGTLDEIVTNWVLSSKDYSLLTSVEPAFRLLLNALTNTNKNPFRNE
ncbi:TetR/AcrR family transcriptional regulator [Aliibacillus thermotolerans]|uniref:TetR/AcrR family transcriptional regulator n=1 Tax=Aliibacillus thermotolerans TaxID=1834418 RepID=A0ABW0U4G7_9BACI|nr:TetR/AcrR family transcriptional regulator [Aliibacillus thermotolerans]